ncbi:MAG: TonB-dependent receptor [Caulobacter sp.]|nr:TonB-dependent receptor [Caulobacter sp.]
MNRQRTLPGLLAGAAAIALCHPAFARAADAPAGGEEPATVAEIVVTASKREERLQDVPTAVTVVTGDQLSRQNVTEVSDLVRSAPALNSAGPFGALSMRGIGSISFSRTSESSVGVVVDGVALAGASTNPPALFDIARVEVLSGPQGTLFGRNSSGGVINIVTNAPNPTRFEALAHADIGTEGNDLVRGMVNLPLGDTAALRISAAYAAQPEHQHNRFDGSDQHPESTGVRARLLWEPTDALSINIIGDYTLAKRDGGAAWTVSYSTPGSALTNRLVACGVHVGPSNDEGCVDGGNKGANLSWGVSGQVDWQVGGLTLTSITALRKVRLDTDAYDVDSTSAFRLNQTGPADSDNVSQELRLTSPSGARLEYVAGLYYFHSDFAGAVLQRGPVATDLGLPFILGQNLATTADTTSAAAFGQATFHVTDRFRLVGGLRYGSEKVTATTVVTLAPGAVAPIAAASNVNASADDAYFSYRVGAQFDFTSRIMAYVTYARGYKGPAINDQAAGPGIPVLVRPEIPKTVEAGLKTTLFDGRLGANLAVFHTEVEDFQSQFFDPAAAAFIFGNAPKLTSKGFSLDVFGRPVKGLTLNGGVAYTDARYGGGYVVACGQGQTLAQGCQNIVVGGVIVGQGDDAGGNRLVGTPEWKVTFSGEYQHRIAGGFMGFVQVDLVYNSKIYSSAAFDPLTDIDGATIVGGRIGLRTQDGRYGVSLYARNLFDTFRPTVRFPTPAAAQQLDPKSYSQMAGPESSRVVGVSLDARF